VQDEITPDEGMRSLSVRCLTSTVCPPSSLGSSLLILWCFTFSQCKAQIIALRIYSTLGLFVIQLSMCAQGKHEYTGVTKRRLIWSLIFQMFCWYYMYLLGLFIICLWRHAKHALRKKEKNKDPVNESLLSSLHTYKHLFF